MERINAYLNQNSLLKNSIYLIGSNGLLSLGGFIFWIFIARLYSTDQIGVATALIAIVNLISALALLGFNTGILRFLPISENKNALINSTTCVVVITSLLLGAFTLLNIKIFAPPLEFVSRNPFFFVLFIIFTCFTALNLLLEAILTAFRSAKYVLIKNFIQAIIKLSLPFFFVSLGAFGIFSSFYIGSIIALFVGAILLYKIHKIVYSVKIHLQEVKKIAIVSIGTYISGLMSNAPVFILPIFITNVLGPNQTAFYYIVATTINVLNLIPQVITQNLTVEGSYSIKYIEMHLKKVFLLILVILIPCISIMFLFGNLILLVFGKQYSTEGFMLLRLLSLSSLIFGFNSILSSLLIVFHQIKSLIAINIIYTLTLFGLSYYLIHTGIVGIGYATILSQFLLLILYLLALIKNNKFYLFRSLI